MKRILGLASLACLILSGCTSAPIQIPKPKADITPEQRAAMQSREYDASMETVFAATIAVLQDLGWKLDSADRASGVIRASTERSLEPLGPKEEKITSYEVRKEAIKKRTSEMNQWTRWEELVIHVEKWPPASTKQRIILSRCGSLPAMSYQTKVDGKKAMVNAPAREESVELLLSDVYSDLFDRIIKAVNLRKNR